MELGLTDHRGGNRGIDVVHYTVTLAFNEGEYDENIDFGNRGDRSAKLAAYNPTFF